MIYFCCDELRRRRWRIRRKIRRALNGIDFLEVLDHDAPTNQR